VIVRHIGCVVRTLGETLVAALPGARIGHGVRVCSASGSIAGEVAAVERARVAIVPFGSLVGVAVGDRVELDDAARGAPLGFAALGRALDAAGAALDGGDALRTVHVRVDRVRLEPRERREIRQPFWTGVPALDGLLTIGRGARVGFFGAPGAGKTALLESIASGAQADAVVLALIGERGREAQAWIERCNPRTTIVCATSDRSSAERIRAADVAMVQARLLRERGLHVVLIVDSLARYCAALREQRVALGEAIGRGGYPPSVWADLARFLECAGNAHDGSVTLLATVLSDGADEREPLSDAARSLLDGHVILSSALARAGHFPAIDVLASASRTMGAVADAQQVADARAVRAALAMLADSRDARDLGLAAVTPALGAAVAAEPALNAFLRQAVPTSPEDMRRDLRAVAALFEVHQ